MNIYKDLFYHRQAIINSAVEAVLGKDYYNTCIDSWSCTEESMADLLYKVKPSCVKKYLNLMTEVNTRMRQPEDNRREKIWEFNVGDYAQSKTGEIGYVETVDKEKTRVRWVKNEGCLSFTFNNNWSDVPTYFVRIGQYIFEEKQKDNTVNFDKIEHSTVCFPQDYVHENEARDHNIVLLNNKINEIIDYINSKKD